MKLRAPGKKPIILKPVRANLGIEAAYRKQLDRMIDDMNKSVSYWLTATYRANPPAMAMDASPVNALRTMMSNLGKKWTKQFNDASAKIADAFATQTHAAAEAVMKRTLRDVGFTVKFTQTPEMKDALQSVIGENIALIKSIPSQHLTAVEGAVMRSVQAGRDLQTLQTELLSLGAKSKNRAAFIARDQSNKATAVMSKARRLSLGLTQSRWRHSGGGVHPRPLHVKADGELYETEKGCLIDGEYIMPGEEPNCRCQAEAVIPGFED
jgi:uncharacterized protein with gpF-like domain